MTLYVNDEMVSMESGITLEHLLQKLGHAQRAGIAVAINQNIIQRTNWSSQIVAENDQIIIIRATQGG